MIQGYHEYKSICENHSGSDELSSEYEIGNVHDTHAVAIKKDHAVAIKKDISGKATTVGHIPRKISLICSIFIRCGGMILCTVNGHRHYSSDLLQDSLEVPCILTFVAKEMTFSHHTK